MKFEIGDTSVLLKADELKIYLVHTAGHPAAEFTFPDHNSAVKSFWTMCKTGTSLENQ